MSKLLKLLPNFLAYQEWIKKAPLDSDEYYRTFQASESRLFQYIIAADILWPEFIEIEGMYIHKRQMPYDWEAWVKKAREDGLSSNEMEALLNHIHYETLFVQDPEYDTVSDEVLTTLANVICEMWKQKLKVVFPEVEFEVVYDPEEHIFYTRALREH
ncbi:MAG: hypothetical protein OEZ02_12340 [Anaerolineae bacterium]|nr:hypothetical protein [Anaerolineae bacterium]